MDPIRGSQLHAGAEGRSHVGGRAWFRINSDGLRDRERSLAKPPGTVRIAVLGDSFAEALQVDAPSGFCSVLERQLTRRGAFGGRAVEVINFGSSGYATSHELLTLRHHVWKYSPDVVLLAFFTGNDVKGNQADLALEKLGPFFRYRQGRLVQDDSFRQAYRSGPLFESLREARDGLIDRSRLLQVYHEARRKRQARQQSPEATPEDAAAGIEPGVDHLVFSPSRTPEWEEAWRITEDLLRLLRDETNAKGAQFWLVTLSCGVQVHPDLAFRLAFQQRFGIEDLFYPDRRLEEFSRREQIQSVVLAPALSEYALRHGVFMHGFPNSRLGAGHWNETGQRLAGEMIAERLWPLSAAAAGSSP